MQMNRPTYTIVFTGKPLPDIDTETAVQRLRSGFPGGDRLAGLLSWGQAAVLKKNVPRETALKIRALGKKCGVELALRLEKTAATTPSKAPSPSPSPQKATGVPGREMATCPWCGHWQPAASTCLRCAKPLAGAAKTRAASVPSPPPRPSPPPKKTFRENFRTVRITFLVLLLGVVAFVTWDSQRDATDWKDPLHVMIYPIDGDGSEEVAAFIGDLADGDFDGVETFFQEQADYYGLTLQEPFLFHLAPGVTTLPPAPPEDYSRLKVIWWSLRLRWWVFQSDTWEEKWPTPDIRVFVVYHEAWDNRVMQDSLGLSKSRTGVVHAFADQGMADANKVVIAHEVLHTLGATDKYNMQNLMPVFPDGYAVPGREPLYPQTHAEIMGGRIPVSANRLKMPESLDEVLVGEQTAAEIRWITGP